MKKILFLGLLLIPTVFFGQRLKTEGKYIVNSDGNEVILRGVGLGGWMLMEGYMMQSSEVADTQHEFRDRLEELMGKEKTDEFFDAWLANHVTKKDVDSLANWGFNSIRVPMHYNLFTLPIEDEPVPGENTWLVKGFDLLDDLLLWCKDNSIYLILDLHGAPGGQGENAAISDYDPTKPSLWESKDNRDKTVALWTKLADRYKDEDWIGGYDLINETNWYKDDMGSNNFLLRQLMGEITDSIRATGDNHIIFIEGNSWANDFNGMTPPWDNNMVYSFHKYWSHNDQGSIQWVLDIRNQHNVPLWMGEAGENSNVWFTEAISLFEENKIGWSWWPMKRIETIVSPYSIKFTEGYKNVLNYWKGEGPKPSEEDAYVWMMELALNSNSSNCDYVKGVHDAMLIQPHTAETRPFVNHVVPGTVFMSDYDMGVIGSAYQDENFANYSLSTGSFQAWNEGWWYRNDGVDIEKTTIAGGNGFNIGYVNKGEWVNYTVDISTTGTYALVLQYASPSSGGMFHLSLNNEDITAVHSLPASGGWTTYDNFLVENIILPQGQHTITFHIDSDQEFNLSKMDFQLISENVDLPFVALTGNTEKTEGSILVYFNHSIDESTIAASLNDFELDIDGVLAKPISQNYNQAKPRALELKFETYIHYRDNLKLNYSGTNLLDTNAKLLGQFSDMIVLNELNPRHIIPVKVQFEDYVDMRGFQLENCEDTGNGKNLAFANPGDYVDYLIRVESTGDYALDIRTASQRSNGSIAVSVINEQAEAEVARIQLPNTGGWQTWETITETVNLPEGSHILRFKVISGEFNLNWYEFNEVILGLENHLEEPFVIYPNPAKNVLYVSDNKFKSYIIQNTLGKTIDLGKISNGQIDLSKLFQGNYIITLSANQGQAFSTQKLIILR